MKVAKTRRKRPPYEVPTRKWQKTASAEVLSGLLKTDPLELSVSLGSPDIDKFSS